MALLKKISRPGFFFFLVFLVIYTEEGPPEQANKTLPFCRLPFLKRSKIDRYFPTNVKLKHDL